MRCRLPHAALAAFALVCGVAFGWVGTTASSVADAAGPARDAAALTRLVASIDAAPAVLANGAEALTVGRGTRPGADHARDVLAAGVLSAALLPLVVRRRLLAAATPGVRRATILSHGERAPPV